MEKKMHISLWVLLSGVILTITLLAGVGVAMGRYTGSAASGATLQARKMSHLTLTATEEATLNSALLGDWETTQEYSRLHFIVSNTDNENKINTETVQYVLRVLVSRGGEAPNGVTVSCGSELYGGTPEAIIEGTELWNQMGDGWVYTFHPQRSSESDPLGEEIRWSMEGGIDKRQEFTLIITGESAASTVELQLIPVVSAAGQQ